MTIETLASDPGVPTNSIPRVDNRDFFSPPRSSLLGAAAALADGSAEEIAKLPLPTGTFCVSGGLARFFSVDGKKKRTLPVQCSDAAELWERLLTRGVLPPSWSDSEERFFLDDWDEGCWDEGCLARPSVETDGSAREITRCRGVSGTVYAFEKRNPTVDFSSENYREELYVLRDGALCGVSRRSSVPPTSQYALLFSSDWTNVEIVERLARESAAMLPEPLYPRRIVWRCVQRKRLLRCLLPFVTLKNCKQELVLVGDENWRNRAARNGFDLADLVGKDWPLGLLASGPWRPHWVDVMLGRLLDTMPSPNRGARWLFDRYQRVLRLAGDTPHSFRPLVEIMLRGYLVDSISEEEIVIVAPNYPVCP